MKTRCLIISGGDFSPLPAPGEDCYVIACDRGYRCALRCGIKPDLLVSDFDSFDGEIDESVAVRRYPVKKDDTDTLLAVRAALELGFREAELYCALGGRLDHTLANLQTAVFAAERGMDLRILSEDTEVRALRGGTLRLPRRVGFSLSVFSALGEARGVSLRGTEYTLENASLSGAYPLGVSNGWAEDEAEISVKEGVLLLVLSLL